MKSLKLKSGRIKYLLLIIILTGIIVYSFSKQSFNKHRNSGQEGDKNNDTSGVIYGEFSIPELMVKSSPNNKVNNIGKGEKLLIMLYPCRKWK